MKKYVNTFLKLLRTRLLFLKARDHQQYFIFYYEKNLKKKQLNNSNKKTLNKKKIYLLIYSFLKNIILYYIILLQLQRNNIFWLIAMTIMQHRYICTPQTQDVIKHDINKKFRRSPGSLPNVFSRFKHVISPGDFKGV